MPDRLAASWRAGPAAKSPWPLGGLPHAIPSSEADAGDLQSCRAAGAGCRCCKLAAAAQRGPPAGRHHSPRERPRGGATSIIMPPGMAGAPDIVTPAHVCKRKDDAASTCKVDGAAPVCWAASSGASRTGTVIARIKNRWLTAGIDLDCTDCGNTSTCLGWLSNAGPATAKRCAAARLAQGPAARHSQRVAACNWLLLPPCRCLHDTIMSPPRDFCIRTVTVFLDTGADVSASGCAAEIERAAAFLQTAHALLQSAGASCSRKPPRKRIRPPRRPTAHRCRSPLSLLLTLQAGPPPRTRL